MPPVTQVPPPRSPSSPWAASCRRALARVVFAFEQLAPLDRVLYPVWAAACTLASARQFYGYMLKQTGGEWSAPLDDVFIHFDYAKATAEGHPFEWVAGNGYSSGNTSLLYPFVLAAGHLAGFRDLALMQWAAIVACTSVFALLLGLRSAFFRDTMGMALGDGDRWSRISSYAFPPLLLAVGALNWSLWSGMEVAFFLAVWTLTWVAWNDFELAPPGAKSSSATRLGLAGVLLVTTRPEGLGTMGAFALFALFVPGQSLAPGLRSWRSWRSWRTTRGLSLLVRILAPSGAALGLQALVNRAFTGEWSANGAIVKLAINNPFLTPQEKLADYTFNFSYAIFRNIEYHFTDSPLYGYLLPGLALVPLTLRRTRRVAALLWLQVVAWLAMVALNGQVRWQNERYTMPAVAWLLLLATLGVSGLLRRREKPEAISMFLLGMAVALGMALALRPTGSPPTLPLLPLPWLLALALGGAAALACRSHLVRVTVATAALGLALFHQAPRLRDQKWFFGRASRNIRDQHIQAGRFLAQLAPRRVLVGDAGALLYASGTKGLDLIGLGGYHSLPFARAGIHGLAASIELIERMAPAERPDVFAIYPSWWGHLPTWFARRELARFPVEGNVICGGAEKVIYEADWHVLGTGHAPRMLPAGDHVVDAVDIADLVSEKHHGYRFPTPAGGWTDMKILADPAAPKKDLFDGGRRIAAGRSESFTVGNLAPNADATLILRTAPDTPSTVRVVAGTTVIASLALEPSEGWVEKSIPLPKEVVRTSLPIAFENDGPGDFVDYHVWVTQR